MQKKKFDKPAYDKALHRKIYDQITVTVEKGQKEVIRKKSKEAGKRSMNEYIVEAIQEKLKREDS